MFKVPSSREVVPRVESGEIVKQGYLRKLKKMRKRYFVLRGESAEAPARLEYYETEKKWKTTTCNPKRSIVLKNCFNINKRTDTRHKFVIALYIRNDEFCIVLDTEEEMESWLRALLTLQRGEPEEGGGPIRPNFEHVWEVYLHSKELGSRTDMVGRCRLCLTDQSVTLVKLERDETVAEKSLEYSLQKIRRCGYVNTFLFIEVGQCTVTGAGNLWLQAEDTNIAGNIHQTIMRYLEKPNSNQTINANKDIRPKARDRSVSVNESSRPASMQKWPTHTGLTRERADSMPSRARTTSECATHLPHPPRLHNNPLGRPPSTSYNRGISYSPPGASSPVSPGSAACSTDSAGSSLSMDSDVTDGHWEDRYSHSLTPDEPVIVEENADDYAPWIGEDEQLNNYVRNNDTSHSCHNSTNNLQTTNQDFKKCNYTTSQVSRLEMNSPGGKAKNGSYVIMSPVDKSHHKPTINHSRGSSLTEEGYVPMAPGNSDDGYVDMDHGTTRRKGPFQSGELSTGSSCSVTSGTPSTDQRFRDYPLDKVSSYFNGEEEIVPAERPTRAYSLGSRPTFNKNRTELPVTTNNERTRAFSVGSKNAKGFNLLKMHNHHPHHMSSHSSMEPSDDMMELDFSKKGRMKNRKKPSSSERLSVPGGSASTLSSAASSYSTAEGSYMDMSPRCSPSLAPSPPKTNRFLAMLSKSPPKYDFLSFTRNSPPVSGYPSPSLGRVPEIEPVCGECGQQSPSQDTDSYVEMTPDSTAAGQKIIAPKNPKARVEYFPTVGSTSTPRRSSREESTLKRKMSHASAILEDNNNTKIIIGNSSNPVDEYVEMDLSSSKSRTRKNTSGEEDYMEMDGRGEKVEPIRSMPIAIQPPVKETTTSGSFVVGTRKNSTGTSPKPSFLQFGSSPSPVSSPYATLGRNRPRKNTLRRDSRDNLNSGSSGSSNSIFPLSLNSSINSPEDFESKCLVDATSGTVMLSTETSRSVDDLTSRVECTVLEGESDDYVMYEPGSLAIRDADYAHMAPVKPSGGTPVVRKTSVPLLKLRPFDRILQGLGVSSGSMTSSSSSPSIKTISEPSPELKESSSLPEEEEEEEETTPVARSDDDSLTPKAPTDAKSKELHYASLDLARSGSESEESTKTLQTQTSLTESSSASSPSPNPADGSSSFVYAEIDFAKSGSSQN